LLPSGRNQFVHKINPFFWTIVVHDLPPSAFIKALASRHPVALARMLYKGIFRPGKYRWAEIN